MRSIIIPISGRNSDENFFKLKIQCILLASNLKTIFIYNSSHSYSCTKMNVHFHWIIFYWNPIWFNLDLVKQRIFLNEIISNVANLFRMVFILILANQWSFYQPSKLEKCLMDTVHCHTLLPKRFYWFNN